MWRTCLAILMLAALAPAARAQADEWQHPRYLYSLQTTGWGPLTRNPEVINSVDLAGFEYGGETRSGLFCYVRERRLGPPIPQDTINERIRSFVPSTPGASTVQMLTIDGIGVVAYRVDDPAGRYVHFFRQFIIGERVGTALHEVFCGAEAPVSSANEAVFHGFLNSLHFPTDQAQ